MQQSADHSGQLLGNYRLIRRLGLGGFAEVYLGEHIHLKTQVAIKVLLTHLTQEAVDTFRHEAQTIAHLRHPSIVQVYDFGLQDNIAYLVMDYAPHGTLRDRHPKGSMLPLHVIVAYVRQIAEALQYAHDQRLIHRDVKPENMLLGSSNEVLLSDFGIALTSHGTFSQNTQNIAGTVVYMAPEQIQGHPRPASDQYALAIVVYEWLCGNRPFQGTFTQIALQQSITPPPPLRQYLPTLPAEVEQVVMIALNKDPLQRFPTIRAFAQALEQVSAHQQHFMSESRNVSSPSPYLTTPTPITTGPPASAYALAGSKQIPHLSRRTALLGICGLIAVGSSGLTWVVLSQKAATNSLKLANGTATITQAALITPATAALITYNKHTDDVIGIDWSHDGKALVTVSLDGTAQVWKADSGERVLSYSSQITPAQSEDSALAVRWLQDSKRFVVGFDDGTAQGVDTTNNQQFSSYGDASTSINSIACSPDEKYLAIACEDGSVQVYEMTSHKLITRFTGHINIVQTIAWSHDGKNIASGGYDSTVQVWDATTGQALLIFKQHKREVTSVAWSVDDSHLVSCSLDNTAQIWDAHSGHVYLSYNKHKAGWLNSVAWSPNGKYVASAGEVGTVTGNVFIGTSGTQDVNMHVWDTQTGDTHATYQSLPINGIAWSPDNTRIATACTNNIAQVWRVL